MTARVEALSVPSFRQVEKLLNGQGVYGGGAGMGDIQYELRLGRLHHARMQQGLPSQICAQNRETRLKHQLSELSSFVSCIPAPAITKVPPPTRMVLNE